MAMRIGSWRWVHHAHLLLSSWPLHSAHMHPWESMQILAHLLLICSVNLIKEVNWGKLKWPEIEFIGEEQKTCNSGSQLRIWGGSIYGQRVGRGASSQLPGSEFIGHLVKQVFREAASWHLSLLPGGMCARVSIPSPSSISGWNFCGHFPMLCGMCVQLTL